MELISFDKLNAVLGLSKDESEYLDLEVIKESVANAFEDYTNRIFDEDKHSHSEIVGDLPTKMIALGAIPIQSISSVLVNGQSTTDYEITGYGIRLGAKISRLKVDVEYVGGLSSVSGSLERAALLQTVYEYQNKDSIGIEVVTTTGGSVVKPELGLLKEVKKLLNSSMHPFPRF